MVNEKVIETVKKLFALAKNNPSAEEAKSAALKAQELCVQHGISLTEVENIDISKEEEIGESRVDLSAKKWKYGLAQICADNFRVKHFYHGKGTLVFVGHETDAAIAAETFKYLFEVGNRLGNKLAREARQTRGYADNVYNSCVVGFCQGIRDALAEQSKALMVVVPEDVEKAFAERTKGCRHSTLSGVKAYNGEAYRRGREQGYNAMKRNALAG